MTFEAFDLHPQVAGGVRSLGYVSPTPIQARAIPVALQGRDVLGLAQTGTGKTAAFVLPLLQRLIKDRSGRMRALILAPTRELAEQIHEAFQALGRRTGLRSMTVYGGVAMNPQIERIRAGVEAVVACPGRLLDHLERGTINLSRVEMLVLDEADRMFDMGFLPEVRRILQRLPTNRQTLLFSATMPGGVRSLAHDILRDPVTVQVDRPAPAASVSHALYPVTQHLKTPLLLELLRHTDAESVLVFTRTKHRAKRLGLQLAKAGYRAASLQGNLSQSRRQAALAGFRIGEFQILVATDIAARGIDVSTISHVVNYDIPDSVDAYTHRIGRAGRAARTGDAFTLVTPEDGGLVQDIERALGAKIDRRMVEGFDYTLPPPKRDTEFARPPRPPRGPGRGGAREVSRREPKVAPRSSASAAVLGSAVGEAAKLSAQVRRYRPRRSR